MHLLHLGEHFNAGGECVLLHLQFHMAVLGPLCFLLSAVQAQGVAGDHVFHSVPLLPGGPLLAVGRSRVGPGGLQPLFQAAQLLAHRLVPVQHLLGGSGQSGQQGLGLVGVGGLHSLPAPQLLQLLGQGACGTQGLLGLLILLLHAAAGLLQLGLDLIQPGAPLGDLALQAVLTALPLLQLLPDTGGALQIVLDVASKYRDGRLQLPDGSVPALNGKAQLVGLDLLLPHLHR